jgi:hypothetical protein
MSSSAAPNTSPAPLRRRFLSGWKLYAVPVLLLAVLAAWKVNYIRFGAQGYVFGYPLVIMDITRENAALSIAPVNVLQRVRSFPDAQFKTVVRPNLDTLYSTAFLDLSQGPLVFDMPANEIRYEVMSFLDAWTHVFASPGTRTQGTAGGRYFLVGPQWQGTVPQGMTLLRSPTAMAWLIGRTETRGEADFPLVHRLQNGLQLTPWVEGHAAPYISASAASAASAWQKSTAPLTPPLVQMQNMRTVDFFNRLTQLMVANPPFAADAPLLQDLARIGVHAGQPVDWSWLEQKAVSLGRWITDTQIAKALKEPRGLVNGWAVPPSSLGQYGTDYNTRIVVAMVGLGANLPEDAMYPSTQEDGKGGALQGRFRYRIHFPAGQWPPVNGFWSITAYGLDNFLIDHPSGRHAVGSLHPMVPNADGSLDVWIQAQAPEGPLQANWLPVNENTPFVLNARLYGPKPEALQGGWKLPAVERQP